MILFIEGLGIEFIFLKLEDRSKFIYKVISLEGGIYVIINIGIMNLMLFGFVVEVEVMNYLISIFSDKLIFVCIKE